MRGGHLAQRVAGFRRARHLTPVDRFLFAAQTDARLAGDGRGFGFCGKAFDSQAAPQVSVGGCPGAVFLAGEQANGQCRQVVLPGWIIEYGEHQACAVDIAVDHQPPPIVVALGAENQLGSLVAQTAAQDLHGFLVTGVAFRDGGRALQDADPVDQRVRRPFIGRNRQTGQHARLQAVVARQRFERGELARVAVGARAPEFALDFAFDKAGQPGQHAVALGGRQLPVGVDLARFV